MSGILGGLGPAEGAVFRTGYAQVMHNLADKLCTSYAQGLHRGTDRLCTGLLTSNAQAMHLRAWGFMHKLCTRYRQDINKCFCAVHAVRTHGQSTATRHGHTQHAHTRTRKTDNGTDTERQEKTHGTQKRVCVPFLCVCVNVWKAHAHAHVKDQQRTHQHTSRTAHEN